MVRHLALASIPHRTTPRAGNTGFTSGTSPCPACSAAPPLSPSLDVIAFYFRTRKYKQQQLTARRGKGDFGSEIIRPGSSLRAHMKLKQRQKVKVIVRDTHRRNYQRAHSWNNQRSHSTWVHVSKLRGPRNRTGVHSDMLSAGGRLAVCQSISRLITITIVHHLTSGNGVSYRIPSK